MVSPTSSTKQISLYWLLIVPLVLQVIGMVGLIGCLSYHNGQYLNAIPHNIERTILLSGFTLLISTTLGLFITHYTSRSIQQLRRASQALSLGKKCGFLPEDSPITELQSLAISFNHVTAQLHQSVQQLEAALQGSQELYQEMVQTQVDFILRSQPDTAITFANESLCQALGLPLEQIIGKKWIDFANEADLQGTVDKLAALSPRQPSFISENRDQRAGGIIGWTQWLNQGVFDERGRLVEIQSVGRDITLLKETEQKLRESQRFIERIADATPSLLYIYDQIGQRNVYANRSVAEVLGYSRSEIQAMGDRLLQIICHPDDFPKLMAAVQRITTAQDKDVIELEYRVRDAQGQWRWLLSRDIVFSRTAEGQVWQTLGTAQDITDRKQAELEVQQVKQFLSSIIENIPDMIFVKDARTLEFLELNKAGEALIGYPKEAVLGKTDYELFPPEQAELFVAQDCNTLLQGQIVDIPEEVVQTQTQGNRLLHTKKIPIFDESGKAQYLLGISEDITGQRELENRLTQLARHAPGMLYQFHLKTDGTSCLPYASDGIRELYGVTPEMVKRDSSHCFKVVYPDDGERLHQSIAESAENLTPWRCEFRICLPGKPLTWLLGSATPRREPDGSTIWHGYITDITEQKAAESLLIAAKDRAEDAENQLQKTQVHLERVNQKLGKLLNLDGLTKIANRRCFNLRLKQEWLRLYRDQKPLSLLLFDVDYFKNYNDCYGHPQGDICLTRIAQCARRAVQRPADLVARYGGEEFAVILPDTDERGAIAVAQRIRLAVAKMAIAHQGSEIAAFVTVSLGLATQIPQSEGSVKNLITQADVALYQAKARGRNQFVRFASLSPEEK